MQRVIQYAGGLEGIKYKWGSGPGLFIEQRPPRTEAEPRKFNILLFFWYFLCIFQVSPALSYWVLYGSLEAQK